MPSYRLKVTKFLGKISQFEFLLMTKKNIFAFKLFLSLNIPDFNLFFMWKLQPPPEKSHPLFPSNPPSKSWGPVKPLPLLKIWLEAQPPPPLQNRGGGCTLWLMNNKLQNTYQKVKVLETSIWYLPVTGTYQSI